MESPTLDNTTCVVVTRGTLPPDAFAQVLDSIIFPRVVVWDNSKRAFDMGCFGRCVAAETLVDTPYTFFQDDDLFCSRENVERVLRGYEPGTLTTLMPEGDYRPGHIRPYLKYLVWQGWGSVIRTSEVMNAHMKWISYGGEMGKDYYIVGADVILGTLTPWKRVDPDHPMGAPDLPKERVTTSAMLDDYERKTRFYRKAIEILDVPDLAEITALIDAELSRPAGPRR